MPHDVFISHASEDKQIANAICFHLEKQGIRCWIAPRDILPGADWGESINTALKESKFMVIVFSESTNKSKHAKNEITTAVSQGIHVIPFRIEDVIPSGALDLHLKCCHWMDAFPPPHEKHFGKLGDSIKTLLSPDIKRKPTVDEIIPVQAWHEKKHYRVIGVLLVLVIVLMLISEIKPGDHSDNVSSSPETLTVQNNDQGIDNLIASLAKKYREGEYQQKQENLDKWSSRIMTLSLMDIKNPGATDDIMREKLAFSLPYALQGKKRVKFVTRELLEKLLEELKLSTSDLADPETSLRIGRLLSVDIILSAVIVPEGNGYKVGLMCINTETSEMIKMISETSTGKDIDQDVFTKLGSRIVEWISADFPLQGKVIGIADDAYKINIGQLHGLKKGDRFEILKEHSDDSDMYSVIGELEITGVEKEMSHASLITKSNEMLHEGNKVREKRNDKI